MWIVWLEKKILKTIGIVLGILIILITALHFYVVNNAESLVEQLVTDQSKGRLKLTVKNIKFNYFSRKVELDNVIFYSNDSLDLTTSYHFQVDKIKLKVKALIPIFTRRELRIDSLALFAPKIEVTRLKPIKESVQSDVSIPHEMGRIYNSIMEALRFLELKRFQLDDGQFRLINKIIPDQQPLTITGMHFHIEDFKVDSTSNAEDFPDSDKMVFWTKNQDITFPDGNHRLAFSRFRIKIKKRIIEIDSCTMIGKKDKDSKSGFNLFLDTLKLTNVDFKALYENDLIKADSVYCKDPKFRLDLELTSKSGTKTKIPNLDTLINQLTGDLQLGYIGVKNAALDITTTRNDKSTSFTSERNNFEMTGLRIDHSLHQPISLEGFDMAINNYENFVKDSSFFLRFDSIRLREKRVTLSNFSINTEPYKDKRNIKVQQFILSGLSWGDLLFDQKIVARQASLFRPVIDYRQPPKDHHRKGNPIANALASLNNIMSLERINVANGKIRIKTRNDIELNFDDADLVVNTGTILDAVSIDAAESSIESLSFKKGIMRTNKLMVNMDGLAFDGMKNQFKILRLNIYDHLQSFNVIAGDVLIDTADFSQTDKSVFARGISWEKAIIEINLLEKTKVDPKEKFNFMLQNLAVNNTQVYLNSSSNALSVFLNSLSTPALTVADNFDVESIQTTGSDLYWYNLQSSVSAQKFSLNDHAPSVIDSISVKQSKNNNSLDISAAAISFIPDVKSILDKKNDIRNVKIINPVISVINNTKDSTKSAKPLPDFQINTLEIEHPVFTLENPGSEKIKKIYWDGSLRNVFLKGVNSSTAGNLLKVDSVKTTLSSVVISKADEKELSSKEGSLDLDLSNLYFQNDSKPTWSVKVNEAAAKNFLADNLGKKSTELRITGGTMKNFELGSSINGSLISILRKNPNFSISDISGYMQNEKINLSWDNITYNKPKELISIDSIGFRPVMSRDSFVAASPWQTDYITFRSKNINITKFKLEEYLEDSIFRAGNVEVAYPLFTSYRDKTPPFHEGIIKPLASKLIQRIPIKLSIDTLLVNNGTAIYTELNDKTGETADIPITRMSGDIFPIKNINITPTDSLRIRLNGFLLDSGWIRLRTRESYLDTASGFQITVRMRPHSMLYLNKILMPLTSVKIQSGYLDTLSMRAIAHDYLSLGEMRMYYHDLKVQFLSNGKENKRKFLQGLLTFIANSFVIKNNNTKRVGVVYFPRIRDRSFINYYIKIAMSGVASSVGAKKNKRLMRRYKKQLKIRHLPAIDFD